MQADQPTATSPATEHISFRTTPHAKAVIEQASSLLGVSMSHFILDTIYQKSMQMLQAESVWQVNQQEMAKLNRLLQQTPTHNPALAELLAEGQDLIEQSRSHFEAN